MPKITQEILDEIIHKAYSGILFEFWEGDEIITWLKRQFANYIEDSEIIEYEFKRVSEYEAYVKIKYDVAYCLTIKREPADLDDLKSESFDTETERPPLKIIDLTDDDPQ